ncbi:hypothetical protein SDC9_126446 [bioreactor metagenome]|uniref:Uncharacterized protein n=1 Tax=bioreactor metagenome TaxID=1076179 RepID=A0A645CR66_9ZZZZ
MSDQIVLKAGDQTVAVGDSDDLELRWRPVDDAERNTLSRSLLKICTACNAVRTGYSECVLTYRECAPVKLIGYRFTVEYQIKSTYIGTFDGRL